MQVLLFMDPSMNRADVVALMQIALAHSSLAYLPCLFICLHSRKKLVNVTRGEKMLHSDRDNNQTSRPTDPERGEGRQAPPPPSVSLPLTLSETSHILKYPYGKGTRRGSYHIQNWTTTDNHFVMSNVYQSSLCSISHCESNCFECFLESQAHFQNSLSA